MRLKFALLPTIKFASDGCKHDESSTMTKAEQAHKAALAELPCALCVRIHGDHAGGNVELHHRRTGGWGKGDYRTLTPLCVNHHRGREGIHHLGTKLWCREFGVTQEELLQWTLNQLSLDNAD